MRKKIEKAKINIFENDSMKLFVMLCGYFLLVLILYSICQIIKFKNCLGLIQILSIMTPIIFYILKNNKWEKKNTIIIVLYLLLTLLLPFLSGKTYDLTVDGNSYHKTAIAFIKNGWNPLYESSAKFQKNNDNIVKFDKDTRIDLWIDHYPKATWIIAATIYNMTGNIESGKAITIILSIMLLIISYNCLQTILSKRWSALIALLLVLNPITLAQVFSYYVDGLMGILFTIELLLLFMINPKEKPNKVIWLCLMGTCAIFVNLKFTGLLCSGVIAAIFYFYWLIKNRKDKEFLTIFKNITVPFIIVFVTAIFLVGSSSYIKNTVDHLNPLYPLIGKDKVDIITSMQPKSFSTKTMPEKFVISLFSKTQNVSYSGGEPEIKLPIKLYKSEIGELYAPDVRIGGFGPYFALITIVSLILFIYSFIIFIKNEKKNVKYIIITLLTIIISSLLVGENWWARYVPQLYLIPIGTLILSVYVSKYTNRRKINKAATCILILTILMNVCCFLYINYKEVQSFVEINSDLKEMKNTKDLKLKLSTDNLYGYYYNLNDYGIKYKVVDEIKNIRYKYSWRVEVEYNEELSETN
jgi:hypothetical protein